MSVSGTSPRDHTLTTTSTLSNTLTTTTTQTAPTTGTTNVLTASPQQSSPPKDDSPTGRSKKTVTPRSPRTPRTMPVPKLRLRSTSSSVELMPTPAKLSQSHPQPATSPTTLQAKALTTSTPKAAQTSTNDTLSIQSHSEPSFQIIRKRIPFSVLKDREADQRMQQIADLIVNDLVDAGSSANDLKVLGRVDTAFYIDRLPDALKSFAKGIDGPTISSSKLLQRYFASELHGNMGWGGAKTLYANFIYQETVRSGASGRIAIGEDSPDIKQAEVERIKGIAEVIVRMLIGYPPTIDSSPLPKKLLRFLIACDQRLHTKLLGGGMKHSFSTDQIRVGRLAQLTNLVVTRLLQPMLSSLAAKNPSQTEIWFLGLLMKGLVAGIEQMSVAFFNKSFAESPHVLQKMATEKLTQERIASRIRKLQSKPTVRHVRTRSADTEPISPRTLRTIEEAKNFRKTQKAVEVARELEEQDWSALDEARRHITENLAVPKTTGNSPQFDAGDIDALVQEILSNRADFDNLVLTPRRASPLEDSDDQRADKPEPVAILTTTTTNTTTTTTTTSTANTSALNTAPSSDAQAIRSGLNPETHGS